METFEKPLTVPEAFASAKLLSKSNPNVAFYVKRGENGVFLDTSHYHLPTESVLAGYKNGVKTVWPPNDPRIPTEYGEGTRY